MWTGVVLLEPGHAEYDIIRGYLGHVEGLLLGMPVYPHCHILGEPFNASPKDRFAIHCSERDICFVVVERGRSSCGGKAFNGTVGRKFSDGRSVSK